MAVNPGPGRLADLTTLGRQTTPFSHISHDIDNTNNNTFFAFPQTSKSFNQNRSILIGRSQMCVTLCCSPFLLSDGPNCLACLSAGNQCTGVWRVTSGFLFSTLISLLRRTETFVLPPSIPALSTIFRVLCASKLFLSSADNAGLEATPQILRARKEHSERRRRVDACSR